MEHTHKRWLKSKKVFGWQVRLGLYADPNGVGASTNPAYAVLVRLVKS